MYNQATAAYQTAAQSTVNPRELEAGLLIKAAAQLQAVKDDWENQHATKLTDALTYNRRLWTLLTTAATNEEHPLPVELKQNMANLGIFVLKHTLEVLSNPAPERLNSLISINRNIALGLRGS